MKAIGTNRIFDFIFSQFGYLEKNLESDIENLFVPILATLGKLSDQSKEKCMLIVMFVYRALAYQRSKELKTLLVLMVKSFTAELKDENVKEDDKETKNRYIRELGSCLYLFICAFQHPKNMPADMKATEQFLDQGMKFMHSTFPDKDSALEQTWTACITGCLTAAMTISQDQHIFKRCESVPVGVLLSQSAFGTIKDESDVYLKSYLQEFDRNDVPLVANLFKILNNKNPFVESVVEANVV
jgi:hypothetical protein